MDAVWNAAATGVFLFAAVWLVLRWLGLSGAALPAPFSDPLPGQRDALVSPGALWKVFFAALLFRLAVALGSFWLYGALSGNAMSLAQLPDLWIRWDSINYIKLAELGYRGHLENGQHLFVVFFPLYVWILRAARLLVSNTTLAGMLVSWVCFGGGSVYFYALAAEEYGRRPP